MERSDAAGYLPKRFAISVEPSAVEGTARVLNETNMPTERTARLQRYGETLAELRRYL